MESGLTFVPIAPSFPRRRAFKDLCAKKPFVLHTPCRPLQTSRACAQAPRPSSILGSLLQWCEHSSIDLHNIAIREEEGMRCLFATRDIQPGDRLLSIPRHAALIVNTESDTPPPLRFLVGLSSEYWASAPWDIRLAIRLLDECEDLRSSYRPYIDLLPRVPSSALFAYETIGRARVAEQLRAYDMHNVADAYRSSIKSRFTTLKMALPEHARSLVTLRKFAWAISTVVNRAFGIPRSKEETSHLHPTKISTASSPEEYGLFPGLDMANCSVHCQTRLVYDRDEDVFHVFTGASFALGEQVYISYGSKSNDDFMFFHGFVEGSNPANTVKIPCFRSWVLDLAYDNETPAKNWDRKLHLLRGEGITHPDHAPEFYLDRFDEDMLFVLRVALASEDELAILEDRIYPGSQKRSKSVSLRNELAVWKAIAEKCERMREDIGEFDELEQERLSLMLEKHPCTAGWQWGDPGSDGELLYKYERQRVLTATKERANHFKFISSSVGRICTVLVPPSQSLLRTDLFGPTDADRDTSGVFKFDVSPKDIQKQLET